MLNDLNKKYLAEARKLAKIIAKNYKPEKIILYGSVAKGKAKKDSDIDFCIIKKTRLPMRKRVYNVYTALDKYDYQFAFEPVVFTPTEIREREKNNDYFIREVFNYGKIIYSHE